MSDFECLPIGTAARLAELETEVERLRAERDDMQRQRDAARGHGEGASISQLIRERDAYRAEVERLREKLLIACNRGDVADAEVGRLQSENESLKELLKDIPPFEAECEECRDKLHQLEQEVVQLAAGHCLINDGIVGDEGGTPYCTMKAEVERLRAQQAELLEALERISGFTLSQFMGPNDMALECCNVAVSAIAKAEASDE